MNKKLSQMIFPKTLVNYYNLLAKFYLLLLKFIQIAEYYPVGQLQIIMFQDILKSNCINSPRFSRSFEDYHTFSPLDLQYELCSNFLKQAKEKIYYKEAELLTKSQSMIQKLNEKTFLANTKDISSTQDSTTIQYQNFDDDDVFSEASKSMLVLRKSKSIECLRRTNSEFTQILRQIKCKCSERAYKTFSNLIGQCRKLKEKISNVQKKQKQFLKKQNAYQRQQQDLILLKKKTADSDLLVKSLNLQISQLKSKIKQLNSATSKAKFEANQHTSSSKIETEVSIRQFLTHKEQIISDSSQKLKKLYVDIQTRIQQPFTQNLSCQRCCSMLKKLKQSILKYRKLMESEAQGVQKLYQKLKDKLK